jgi:hypothetical protein
MMGTLEANPSLSGLNTSWSNLSGQATHAHVAAPAIDGIHVFVVRRSMDHSPEGSRSNRLEHPAFQFACVSFSVPSI